MVKPMLRKVRYLIPPPASRGHQKLQQMQMDPWCSRAQLTNLQPCPTSRTSTKWRDIRSWARRSSRICRGSSISRHHYRWRGSRSQARCWTRIEQTVQARTQTIMSHQISKVAWNSSKLSGCNSPPRTSASLDSLKATATKIKFSKFWICKTSNPRMPEAP